MALTYIIHKIEWISWLMTKYKNKIENGKMVKSYVWFLKIIYMIFLKKLNILTRACFTIDIALFSSRTSSFFNYWDWPLEKAGAAWSITDLIHARYIKQNVYKFAWSENRCLSLCYLFFCFRLTSVRGIKRLRITSVDS